MAETIWMQCANRLMQLAQLNNRELDVEEVDRLSILVAQELTINVEMVIMKITQNPENKFDEPIPF